MVSFAELAHDALTYSKTHKRSNGSDLVCAPDSITPQELKPPGASHRRKHLRTRNGESLVYRLGTENGKVQGNLARLVKHRLANNARTRWLAPDEEARLRAVIEH